jgi:hypothetical protein
MEFEPVRHIKSLVKIEQIDATAEQDVLAVVDDLSRLPRRARERIRCCAPSQEWACFKELHLISRTTKRSRGRKPGEAAADDDDSRHSMGRYAAPRLALGRHALPPPAAAIVIDQADRNPEANRKKK